MTKRELNAEDRTLLAGTPETPIGRTILRALDLEAARVGRALDDPRLNSERIRDDFRYAMGEKRGVEYLRRLIDETRKQLGITNEDEP